MIKIIINYAIVLNSVIGVFFLIGILLFLEQNEKKN